MTRRVNQSFLLWYQFVTGLSYLKYRCFVEYNSLISYAYFLEVIYKCRIDKNSFAGTKRKEITEQNMINLFL